MLSNLPISNLIPPLKTSDTVQKALARMNEFKLYHLPLVHQHQFLGLISEKELKEVENTQLSLSNLALSIINPFVYSNAHIYDVLSLFENLKLSVVPVLDEHKKYLGLITVYNLIPALAEVHAAKEKGGIVVLNVGNRNNSLVQIAQIVESDNAQIISSYVSSFPNSTLLEITLKINKTELSGIIAAFERYNYEIKAVYNVEDHNNYEDRFNSLMNYLNV